MRKLFTQKISMLFLCFTCILFTSSIHAQTVETFGTPGPATWVCPPGVTSVQVQCWGAGGAGGGVSSGGALQRAAGGGSGGSYVTNTVTVVPGTTYNITVGAGGVWSGTVTNFLSYGLPGGKSEFSGGAVTTITASGGTGGGGGNTATVSGSGGVLGGLYGFTVTAAGINYTTGTTTIDLTGGGGSGATTGFVVASGGINTIATFNQGSGFTSAPTVTINSTNTPTAGSGAAATALVNLNINAGGTPTTGVNGIAGISGASGSGGAGGIGGGPGGGAGGATNAGGATGAPGIAGTAPGGGGSGGFQGSSNTNSRYGGNGGAGLVKLTYAAAAINYYYKGTGSLSDVANWGTNPNGSGTAPGIFTAGLQIFNIRNTAAVSTTAPWTVSGSSSKIIVGDATVSPVALTITAGNGITGPMDIHAASSGANVVNVTDAVPNFGTLDASSEVHFQSTVSVSTPYTFGKLFVDGASTPTVTFNPAAETRVLTSLLVADNCVMIGNGATLNYLNASGATVTINGTLRTSKIAGLVTANITPAGIAANGFFQFSGAQAITLGANSTIEYNNGSGIQTVTPRNDYANLAITANNGKSIAGATNVSTSLSIINSQVTGLSNVTLANNATITRAAASTTLDAAPIFAGTVNVIYSGVDALSSSFEIPSTPGVLNDLTVNTTAVITLATATTVKGTLTVNTGATLATGGNLTLKSNATGTARVANSAGIITGNVTVERYIPALGRRAWRLLGANVSSSGSPTINASWQEGGAVTTTGTHITGGINANGFDGTSGASIFYYNGTTLQMPVSTNATKVTDNGGAYFLFVRGNRTLDINAPGINGNTTLRQTGSLNQGNITTGVAGASFSLIPNPYASAIDYETVYATNPFATFYVWDANLAGVGGYRTIVRTGINTYSSTPTTADDNSMRYLRSGQAFFVNGNTTFNFSEEMKTAMQPVVNVYRPGVGSEEMTIDLRVMDGSASGILYDGVRVQYNNSFPALVDGNDAPKLNNFNENLAIFSHHKNLAVEQRPLADAGDTLFLKLWNTSIKNYRFNINPSNFSTTANLNANLIDNYLNTSTPVSLSTNTMYEFSVTSNTASAAENRFMIVYKASTPLPVNFINVKAFTQNAGIQVEWNVEAEVDIEKYEIERSASGTAFENAGTVIASNSKTYNWFDATAINGANYYRIKVLGKDGKINYSNVVKVVIGKGATTFSVYPNPVKVGEAVNIQSNHVEKGKYSLNIYNMQGQKVFTRTISIADGSGSQSISIGKLSSGIYNIEMVNVEKEKWVKQLIIK